MKINYKYIFTIYLTIAISSAIFAQSDGIPGKPVPPKLVNDYAGFLTPAEQFNLENKLVAINDSSTTQIAVVILKSLNGYDVNDLGARIIQKWGIGQKDKNNGILILVKPKSTDERGAVAISTGYGVEHLITDALAKEIVENEILPAFKNGQNYVGLDKAINTINSLTRGEFTPAGYAALHKKSRVAHHFPFFIIIIIFLFIISFFGRSSQSGRLSTGAGLPFWMLMGGMFGGSSRSEGSWGDFSSGGNEFGGFGGGDSGGGGASGSW